MPISANCPERHRLAKKAAQAVAAVIELNYRQREARKKTFGTLFLQFDRAKTTLRNAEKELREHIKQHGCLE